MGRWLQNLAYKLQGFMYGRYGADILSKHLNIAALVLVILSLFVPFLYPLSLGLLVWSTFRMYSKNIYSRARERDAYLRFLNKLKRRKNLLKNRWRDRKTHRFYKCPGCKEYLRVPKGRGEVHITCPKCRHEIMRNT